MRPTLESPSDEGWVKPLLLAGTFAYLAGSTMLVWNGRDHLFTPLIGYRSPTSWIIKTTNDARVQALVEAGRTTLATFYRELELFSLILILAAIVVGVAGALPKARRPEADPINLMTMTVASILAYATFSGGAAFLGLLWGAGAIPLDPGATPAFWFLSMMTATILISWTAALLIHDITVLALQTRGGSHALHS